VAAAAAIVSVVGVLAGGVHSARDVRKAHPTRLDAFSSGDAGPIGSIEGGRVKWLRNVPARAEAPIGLDALPADESAWPWVEIVTSTAGADARAVDALVEAGCRGIVVAATGNGSVHRALEAALRRARAAGVAVLRSSRCQSGTIIESAGAAEGDDAVATGLASAGDLTPQKARVELLLRLLAG